MSDTPELREKQVQQLAFYIGQKKCLDRSEPSTGKTPPCCVFSYYVWDRKGKKTLWAMPQSLLDKNRREMLRFTEFEDKDVVILTADYAPMTKSWRGPTFTRTKTIDAYPIEFQGVRTNTYIYGNEVKAVRGNKPFRFVYTLEGKLFRFGSKRPVTRRPGDIEVNAILGPDMQPQKQRFKIDEVAKDLIAANRDAKVFICTFAFMAEHWERLLETVPELDLLLGDEIHMPGGWSTPGTKATDSLFFVMKHFHYFVGMTGTLVNGRLDSAFPAIHVIEPRYYGGHAGFLLKHAGVTDDYGRVQIWKNEPHLTEILSRHSIRRTFEEVYGKEPVVFFTEYVNMDQDVQDEYDKFEEQGLLELNDGRILDGTLAGVYSIRCRQIMAHPETMGLATTDWTPRDERIRIHLSEGQKTLIFSALKPEQERLVKLAQSMGLRVALINSDVSMKERTRINNLAEAGLLDVIVASGATAAVGFNWELFDLVLFAAIDFTDTNIKQAYRRASRGTRTKPLRVIFIRYESAIEDRSYQIVLAKSELANRVDDTSSVLEFGETIYRSPDVPLERELIDS